ncbi:cytochrome C biogenesis protein [Desulfosporosinus sp. HMP52]|uniref:heme lyase CcmF/NrfE family subunit n=1 Tax=Desulfosporosinus sp. HMP52 TaxID=1487923 RepID=UPI00051F902B|nr:heme lyase CcmF/NrfE family subunit [Desulfosporosinus sp. HMP52]KGK89077.1 cytochrome C biogenesis protein [Desulfosporosinus sp. HMP52]
MANIGTIGLSIAFGMGIYSVVAFFLFNSNRGLKYLLSAKNAVYGTALFTTISVLAMLYALITGDFSIEYVTQYTSQDLPAIYKLTALWAGNAGSLLFWAWILVLLAALVTVSKENREYIPYASPIMMVVSVFFLFMLNFVSQPFVQLLSPPPDGMGMNPMLQNPGMVIHPVTLYLGYVGFTVPFAFAMAALIMKNPGDQWIKLTRKWTLISWLFLTLGNLFGAQWAYVELGWGGYWAWDPVENASLMPWLTGSAFLHSVMVQERKNMLKIWNMVLIIVTFGLTLFGTFLVRSGVVASVHAFGNSSLGAYFLIFTSLIILAALYLVADRINLLRQGNQFESYISKESSFLLNNLLLVGSAFSIFWGTVFPIVSEAVVGQKIAVGIPFFNQVNAPIGLAFTLLMGICPLIAWRKANFENIAKNFLWPWIIAIIGMLVMVFIGGITKPYALIAYTICVFVISSTLQDILKGVRVRKKLTGENLIVSLIRLLSKNRRRYGGYVIHMGIVMMIVGITGSNVFNSEAVKTFKPGETAVVGDYTISFKGLQQTSRDNMEVIYADLRVIKNNYDMGNLQVEKVFYSTSEQPMTEPAIISTFKEDFYVLLTGWEDDGSAIFKIHINPQIKWLWTGGWVIVIGVIFALWPGKGSGVGSRYLGRGEVSYGKRVS